jgi:hypothetical protein
MSSRIRDFVNRYEESYNDSKERSRIALIELEWYIDFLNTLLAQKSNRRYGANSLGRIMECNKIRDSIADTYDHINYYKNCMKYEDKEMKRIYDTYILNKNTEEDEDNDFYSYNYELGYFE